MNKGTAEVIAALDKIRAEFNEANTEKNLSISVLEPISDGFRNHFAASEAVLSQAEASRAEREC